MTPYHKQKWGLDHWFKNVPVVGLLAAAVVYKPYSNQRGGMSLLDFEIFRLAWWLLLLLCSVVVASKNENHHANLLHPVFRMRIRRKRTKVLQRTCTLL